LTIGPGEIWLADGGAETRHLVYVISDARFHRLAERVVVAPVNATGPAFPRPWHVPLPDGRHVAVHQLGSIPAARLLELVERVGPEVTAQVRRAVRAITA
jgi:mRNA-degrading endonuclease toxin of MazEF toxin-antitoxin module